MRARAVAILAVAAVVLSWGTARAVLGNPSTVNRYAIIDGDTFALLAKRCFWTLLKLGCPAQRLRLEGADAFESAQTCRDASGAVWPCGAVATERLRQLVNRPDFTCNIDPEFIDRHAREFAVCYADGQDVGATMVREGLAFAFGRDTQYLPLENQAKEAKRGGWAGQFVRPQYFRQGAIE